MLPKLYSYKFIKSGFTLVELLVVITITAIIVTMGLSSYAKSRDRQIVQTSRDTLLNFLEDAKKSALIGEKTCSGAFTGVEISLTATSISRQSHCTIDSEAIITEDFTDFTFVNTPANFTFKPLSGGITFGSGTSTNIEYAIGSNTYRITIVNPGTITYEGSVSP